MHGTVEWLPGQPLGNDRQSWSDELLGELPNIYVYAANNPSGKLFLLIRFLRNCFRAKFSRNGVVNGMQRVFLQREEAMELW
jgi:CobN/Magnesium Chelatase